MAVPNEAGKLTETEVQQRRQLAYDHSGTGWRVSWVLVTVLLGVMAVFATLLSLPEGDFLDVTEAAVLLWLFTGIALLLALHRPRAAGFDDWIRPQAFPIDGVEQWLVCDRPLMDVISKQPIDFAPLGEIARKVDPAIRVDVIDDRTARLAIPPLTRGDLRCGDIAKLRRVITHAVLPLHRNGWIDRLELGGLVEVSRPTRSRS